MYSKISRRYSQALYEEAKNINKLDDVEKDRQLILNTLKSSKDLANFFHSPVIDKSKKISVIKEIFKDKISPLMLNFILLLVERQREEEIVVILHDFKDLKNDKEGIVEVKVTTAVELNDEEKKGIKQTIDNYTHLKSEPSYYIDKDIIGGFVVKIKDTILDASIKRQLEVLRKRFKEGDIALN